MASIWAGSTRTDRSCRRPLSAETNERAICSNFWWVPRLHRVLYRLNGADDVLGAERSREDDGGGVLLGRGEASGREDRGAVKPRAANAAQRVGSKSGAVPTHDHEVEVGALDDIESQTDAGGGRESRFVRRLVRDGPGSRSHGRACEGASAGRPATAVWRSRPTGGGRGG
jgi:hypothetical protein